jgi:hypothetical protein
MEKPARLLHILRIFYCLFCSHEEYAAVHNGFMLSRLRFTIAGSGRHSKRDLLHFLPTFLSLSHLTVGQKRSHQKGNMANDLHTNLLIHNEYVPSSTGETLIIYDPTTHEIISDKIQVTSEQDVDNVVSAAKKAFPYGTK